MRFRYSGTRRKSESRELQSSELILWIETAGEGLASISSKWIVSSESVRCSKEELIFFPILIGKFPKPESAFGVFDLLWTFLTF